MPLALAPVPRNSGTSVNLSVGLLLLLLIGSLLLYRFGAAAAASAIKGLPAPTELWRIELTAGASGAATAGRFTYILTKNSLGDSALMLVDERGLLIRTESLGTTGSFDIRSSSLGAVCAGREQGTLSVYGSDGRRRWAAHAAGPITAVSVGPSGVAAGVGPAPGNKAGDSVVAVSPAGAVSSPLEFPYGAITGLTRGPGRSLAASVFTADPGKAAESLVFMQADGTLLPVVGQGLAAARLAAGDEFYFVGTTKGLAAYDSCGQRRWTARVTGIRSIATGNGVVVTAHGDCLTAFRQEDGKRLWQRDLGAPLDRMVGDGAVFVAATLSGLTALDWSGTALWMLPRPAEAWDCGDGRLVVIQKEMAIAYRTR